MTNPFEIIEQKLEILVSEVSTLKQMIGKSEDSIKTPFSDFCREHGISRVTGYSWIEKDLIKTELIGGRRFVVGSSIRPKKYQRV